MYYVLKTHNKDTKSFWGISAIAVYKTKREAEKFCKAQMSVAEHNIKLLIVKAVNIYKVTEIKYQMESL